MYRFRESDNIKLYLKKDNFFFKPLKAKEIKNRFHREMKTVVKKFFNFLSGWQDSNLRPPRPKRGAMTGLRYTPIFICIRSD